MNTLQATDLRRILKEHANFSSGFAGGKRADLRLKNLSKLRLDKVDLREAILTGCLLSHASLRGADLRGADLYGADLTGADLRSAKLDRADLRGCVLRGANLESASLAEADLRSGQVTELAWKFQGHKMTDEESHRSAALKENIGDSNLADANLGSADLAQSQMQSANLEGANLKKANLEGAKLMKANLKGANLEQANLSETSLQDACLDNASFRGAIVNATNFHDASMENAIVPESLAHLEPQVRARMTDHHVWLRTNGERGRRAELTGVKLPGINLGGVNLSGMNLARANLLEAHLRQALCLFTCLDGAHLGSTDLAEVDFDAASLQRCTLAGADLTRANFRPIELCSPDGQKNGRLWPPNLRGANLARTLLHEAYFKGARLEGAMFDGAAVEGSVFLDCVLDEGAADYLCERGAVVRNTDSSSAPSSGDISDETRREAASAIAACPQEC